MQTLEGQKLWELLVIQRCSYVCLWKSWEEHLLAQLGTHLGIAVHQFELQQQIQIERTERQRAESELAQIFNLSFDIICVVGMDGYLKRCNPAIEKALGFSSEELMQQSLLDFVHPDDQKVTVDAIEKLAEGKALSYFENRCRCQNGSYKWLSWTFNLDPTERLIYAIARDITQQKELEALKETQFRVTQTLAEQSDTSELVPNLLQSICQGIGWQMGEFWSLDSSLGELELIYSWYERSPELAAFATTRYQTRFSPGDKLPGTVWQTGSPILIGDLTLEDEFLRQAIASHAGLPTTMAIPIVSRNQVISIMVFYSRAMQQVDSTLIDFMTDLGHQIGQYFQRRQTEQSLQASEERLRLMLAVANVGTWDWNLPTGQITWCNCHEQLFGTSSTVFEGKYEAFQDCIHLEDRDRLLQAMNYALEEKTEYRQEFRVVLSNSEQEVRWMLAQGKFLYDEGDRAFRMLGTVIDTTERKQMELALKHANEELEIRVEERTNSWKWANEQLLSEIAQRQQIENALKSAKVQLQAVLDAVPGAVSWISSDLHYLGVNRYLAATLNCVPEAFAGQEVGFLESNSQFSEFIHWFFEASLQTASREITTEVEGCLRSYLIVAQKYDEGRAAVSVGIDITHRKQTEQAFQVSEEKFRKLVEQTTDWVWEIDKNAVFTYVNPQVQEILGYQPEELLGKQLQDFMPEDAAKRFMTLLACFVADKQAFTHLEDTLLHKQGYPVVIESSGSPMFDQQGQFQGYRGITRDITERKQVEREIRKAFTKEKELNELKTRFISMASHEFRTPLTTILASSESLEHYMYRWNEEKQKSVLKRIQNAAKHMTDLLNDVLLVGKAEAGKLEFKPTALNLEQFCSDLVDELQPQEANSHRLIFTKSGDGTNVLADEKLLRHILINLLSNALKYSSLDSSVQFTLSCSEESIILSVQDHGIGIPVKDQQRLFETFHRATNVGNIAGTGLGLAIVKRAVEVQGGKITVDSTAGIGTTFTVVLTRYKGDSNHEYGY